MKAELRKEYEAIAQQFASSIYDCTGLGEANDIVRSAVAACQELADRPPRELTDAEIYRSFGDSMGYKVNADQAGPKWIVAVRAVIAAYVAKQREPQVVKFRAARNKDTGEVDMLIPRLADSCDNWEWLEPAQEFEVRI